MLDNLILLETKDGERAGGMLALKTRGGEGIKRYSDLELRPPKNTIDIIADAARGSK